MPANMPAEQTALRPIHAIASDIRGAWPKVYFGAEPYLRAMGTLTTCADTYGWDDGRSIVLYFLSNAAGFRGTVARNLKAELRTHLGVRK